MQLSREIIFPEIIAESSDFIRFFVLRAFRVILQFEISLHRWFSDARYLSYN